MYKHNLALSMLLMMPFPFGKHTPAFILNKNFEQIRELQALKTVNAFRESYKKISDVKIEGCCRIGDDGGGIYTYDSNDKTCIDNGGAALAASDEKRFKLKKQDGDIRKFGARIDGITDDSKAVEKAINAEGLAIIPKVEDHKALLASGIKINRNAKISGDGTITTKPGKQNIFQVSSTASLEIDGVNIDLPEGFEGDVIRTASSPTYTHAPITLKNIKGTTQGNGKLITVMERRTNVTITGCTWQGGTGMCLLRAAKNAKVADNIVRASARAIVFFGGSFNAITGNTINGENAGKTGINFFSNRHAAGADNLERGNIISKNIIRNVTEEGISFDCIGNDSSRLPENPVAPIVTVDKLLKPAKSFLDIRITNIPNAADNWANNYYAIILTGNGKGLMFAVNKSSANSITVKKPGNDDSCNMQQGDKILITAGAIQNIISENTIDNAGTHAIALYGSCWGNQVMQNTITNSKWRGISIVSVLGNFQHAYSGMNLVEKNSISMKYDAGNKNIPKLPGAAICIESREYLNNIDYITPRTFGNLLLDNKVSNMPILIIKAWNNNIVKNEISNTAAGIELMNAFNTASVANVSNAGSAIKPLYKKDGQVNATGSKGIPGNNIDLSSDNSYQKFTVTYASIAPSSSQTQYLPVSSANASNVFVIPVSELPEGCVYSSFITPQKKAGIRVFNLSVTNSVEPGSLIFAVKWP